VVRLVHHLERGKVRSLPTEVTKSDLPSVGGCQWSLSGLGALDSFSEVLSVRE
jgi:hypothetical protein